MWIRSSPFFISHTALFEQKKNWLRVRSRPGSPLFRRSEVGSIVRGMVTETPRRARRKGGAEDSKGQIQHNAIPQCRLARRNLIKNQSINIHLTNITRGTPCLTNLFCHTHQMVICWPTTRPRSAEIYELQRGDTQGHCSVVVTQCNGTRFGKVDRVLLNYPSFILRNDRIRRQVGNLATYNFR